MYQLGGFKEKGGVKVQDQDETSTVQGSRLGDAKVGVAKRASPPRTWLAKMRGGLARPQSYCGLEFPTRPA